MKKLSKKFIGATLSSVLFVSSVFSMNVNNVNAASKLKINKTKAEVYIGKTVQLKVTGTKNKIIWTSNNKKIATVTTKGKVKGVKKGTATITAKVSKKKLTCKVTVKEKDTVITNTPNVETVPTETPVITQNPTVEPTVVPTSTVTSTVEPTMIPTSTPTTSYVPVQTEKQIIKNAGNYSVKYNKENDTQQVFFSLEDDKEILVKGSGTVGISIANSNDRSLYLHIIKFEESNFNTYEGKLLCCLEIPNSEIRKSDSDLGTLWIDIELDTGEYFGIKALDINNLPRIGSELESNINKLKKYIADYGLANDKGDKFIKLEKYVDGTSFQYGIVYEKDEEEFRFISSSQDSNCKDSISMYIDTFRIKDVSPEYNMVYSGSSKYGFKATTTFNMFEYKKGSNVYFNLKDSTSTTINESEIQDISNATLRVAFAGWNVLLLDKVGIQLKDIGFTSY